MDHDAIANLLEKVADFVDATEAGKQAAVAEERNKLVDAMCSKFAEATGEEIGDDLRNKLASTDTSIISILEKMATSTRTEELGAPSDRSGAHMPLNTKEAADAAGERFVDWCLS